MALYSYKKEYNRKQRQAFHAMSYVSLVVGSLLMFWSFYPIISFEIYSKLFISQTVSTPIPRTQIVSSLKEADSVLGSFDVYSSNLKDFVQADQWFPTQHMADQKIKLNVKDYYLSIPKINVSNAHVVVGGNDLSQSLIHYVPMSLPGEYGNVSIFGHSTLPQLYDPKNYKTIFTYLPSLEKGDTVLIKMGDLQYEYEVFDMFVVKPDHISVLEQKYDAAYLTLVTCVPPGTYWNRLVVKAKLKGLPGSL
jgi:sortase A